METTHTGVDFQRGQNRHKLRPLVALRALARVTRDPEDTASGALMVEALSGASGERMFQRFRRHPAGRAILRERRSLYERLTDAASLAALPDGTLGRCYHEWTREEEISADGLADAVDEVLGIGDLDEERRFVASRGRDMHDLWHVATGYGRDALGEAALLVFTLRQVRNTGLILPTLLSIVFTCLQSREAPRILRQAWTRAGRAVWMPVQAWEDLLDEPLDVVRKKLRVAEPPRYEPVDPGAFRRT